MARAYAYIGQGTPTVEGHINCSDFVDLPFPGVTSMAVFTDTTRPNPYFELDNSSATKQLANNETIPPGRYSSDGFSLVNYNVNFVIPSATNAPLSASVEEIKDAIIEGLQCNANGNNG